MRYRNDKLIDRLAAEYVVGTLRGGARSRFERLRSREPGIARFVRLWEDRLHGLTAGVQAVAPSPGVWPRIALRAGLGRERARATAEVRRGRVATRWLALAASLALLAIGVLIVRQVEREPASAWQTVAQVDAADGKTLWTFEYDRRAGALRVHAVGASAAPAAKAFELWALPIAEGGAPVSLGLLPRTGAIVLPLSSRQLAALRVAGQIAVSLEPPGGSPTGLPTGPVLHVAPLDLARSS